MKSHRVYQEMYGTLKSTHILESVTTTELSSVLELIAPQFNATVNMFHNHLKLPYFVLEQAGNFKVVIKSIDRRWSDEHASDKLLLLSPICEQGSMGFEDVNELNRSNPDVKFTVFVPKNGARPYLGIDKFITMAGGITVQSIIMMVNELIFNQKVLRMALKDKVYATPKADFNIIEASNNPSFQH